MGGDPRRQGAHGGLLGGLSLAIYGVVVAFQPENAFGRVLAGYGGVFIVGSMAWGVAFDSFLVGVAVILYAPR